jgi:hypothetical protein
MGEVLSLYVVNLILINNDAMNVEKNATWAIIVQRMH